MRARTLFFGSGPVALPALLRLLESDIVAIEAVVTAPPRLVGRKQVLTPTPVGAAAADAGQRILTPPTLRDAGALAELEAVGPELIVLADYGRLIPPAVLDLPRHGALNVHPSLLPRHRGAAPVVGAILAGDAATGVTLMRMDEGLDTGPIVAQAELALHGDEVAPELEARLAELGADLLVERLSAWLDGSLVERPQPEAGATLTRPLRREDGRMDPARSPTRLEREVRAYQPWPGSFTHHHGQRLKVWRASVVPDEPGGAAAGPGGASAEPTGAAAGPDDAAAGPGSLVPWHDSLAFVADAGLLRLDEVQPAGGTRMSGAAYRRGRPESPPGVA